MTYAPADLLAVQRYARDKTGQAWTSLGIVGDTSHNSSGGYHVGHDVLHALGTAPEDPGSDYSYTDSPRDRAGLTDAASAFDLGGGFPRFLEFNAWMRARLLASDPRARDVREMIHTLDGRTVRRIDRTGRQPDAGDSSHLTHTHFSFFRDSEGRRAGAENFLGLLTEFFDGPTPGGTPMALIDDAHFAALAWRMDGIVYGRDQTLNGPTKGESIEPIRMLKRIEAALTKVLEGQGATAEDIDALLARPTSAVTLDAGQVTQLGADIAAVLVARPDTPLGEADIPAIQAGIDRYFRTHFGQD